MSLANGALAIKNTTDMPTGVTLITKI